MISDLETQREPVPRDDAGELDTTLAFLRFARSCVTKKLDGLDDEAVRRSPVVSGTNLLGLVQHLTDSERYWFGHTVAGDPAFADLDFSMEVPAPRSTAEVLEAYREACAASDAVVTRVGLEALTAVPVDDRPLSVRWVVAHMTSETARHAGHADVVRELLDGTTGR